MLDYQFYKREDRDETIILLHGMGGSSKIFYKQIRLYQESFNVLAIHLPGHGESPDIQYYKEPFNYDLVVGEILKTLDTLQIREAHFIGISLGSVVIHHILQTHPDRVKSAVMGGCVTRFNVYAKTLFHIGNISKNFVPFMWIYRTFAHIMMPKVNHKKSRDIFIHEAKKMKRENFLSWFKVIGQADVTYKHVQEQSGGIPKLYISGQEDHIFVHKLLKDIEGDKSARVLIIENCGHVCNIEKPEEFNAASLRFLREHLAGVEVAI
ncbi:alpha/beta hydrolase [Mesobacillus maritimus]|uniref:alpha/beta fold hydrolase n=1 Tax=Mesobacillus maritimus TaxID=1643336 RepID=UPI00203B1386|nr:alpha/beta hydrolase [Mesobacillus maritimus]MCM3587024.1 alpha/beta hydrolase [Mesobacillus maritimus]